MEFDGPRVDAWNFFTITVQVGQNLRATRTTKHSCQRALYSKKKSGKCWMSSITWWAKCLFFVQNSLRAWTIPIVQFGKQNSSSKFFLVKRWHFWTCFTLQIDMKVTKVPLISNLNFEERCFSTCIPSINDVWNSPYITIKLNLTLKFWKC